MAGWTEKATPKHRKEELLSGEARTRREARKIEGVIQGTNQIKHDPPERGGLGGAPS